MNDGHFTDRSPQVTLLVETGILTFPKDLLKLTDYRARRQFFLDNIISITLKLQLYKAHFFCAFMIFVKYSTKQAILRHIKSPFVF